MRGIKWTSDEIIFLLDNYSDKGKGWCIENMGKSEGAIRSQAAQLGLKQNKDGEFFKEWQKRAAKSKEGKKKPEHSKLMKILSNKGLLITGKTPTDAQKKSVSEKAKKRIKEQGHPRGFLGGKHGSEAKEKMSEASKAMWGNPNHKVNSDEYRQMLSDRSMKQQQQSKSLNRYSRARIGTYDINGKKIFFRSSWEANYALYLDFVIDQRQDIIKWEFEVDTFWFEAIRRGVRSYKPDFKIHLKNGSVEYHEVKGWMDPKSKTKLSRMKKYHPEIKIVLVDSKPYKEIIKKMSGIIKFF